MALNMDRETIDVAMVRGMKDIFAKGNAMAKD
jgi:hypothetical protein